MPSANRPIAAGSGIEAGPPEELAEELGGLPPDELGAPPLDVLPPGVDGGGLSIAKADEAGSTRAAAAAARQMVVRVIETLLPVDGKGRQQEGCQMRPRAGFSLPGWLTAHA